MKTTHVIDAKAATVIATSFAVVGAACGGGAVKPMAASGPQAAYRPPRIIDLSQLAEVEHEVTLSGGRIATGTTVVVDIPATQSHFTARPARIYLPPAWFEAPATPLPSLLLLPGAPGGPTDWTEDGEADDIANAFASRFQGRAPIIVMPDTTGRENADSECVNSTKFGNVETYLTVDVPAYIRSEFRAATGLNSLAVAGLSAGGTCSTVLALRNPGIFPTFASFSGFATPTYGNDSIAESLPILYDGSEAAYLAHDPLTLLGEHRYPSMAAWFESGVSDHQPWADAQRLAAASRQAGMQQVSLVGIPGGHTWEVWQASLTAALPWLSARMGLTPAPTSPADGVRMTFLRRQSRVPKVSISENES